MSSSRRNNSSLCTLSRSRSADSAVGPACAAIVASSQMPSFAVCIFNWSSNNATGHVPLCSPLCYLGLPLWVRDARQDLPGLPTKQVSTKRSDKLDSLQIYCPEVKIWVRSA